MEIAEEKKLVEKAKQGDVQAFESLLTIYEKTIYNICLRMLHNEEEACDATQEVCIKLWKQIHLFENKSKLGTWIYRIATNQCLDLLRKNKNKKEISLYQKDEKTEEEWILDRPDERANVEKQIQHQELRDILQMALMEIKEDYRVIIILRDIEHYAYEEIAEILSLTLGTVKSRLSRARLALKKVLKQNKEPYKSFFRLKEK